MKDITEIIKDIIDLLDYEFICKEVVTNVGSFTLKTCNTYWLRPAKQVTINGFPYIIKSIDINKSITVEPIGHIDIPLTGVLFDIPMPTYRHGTARAINEELTTIDQMSKTPFVWLYEIVTENINEEPTSEIGLECDLRLFIFDEANPNDWHTEDHYAQVIRPLKELSSQIQKVINSDEEKYQPLYNYSRSYLPNWGEFNGMKGNGTKIFDEQWSGIQMAFNLVVNKSSLCDDCN